MPFRTVDDLYEQIENWAVAPDLKSEIPDFLRLTEIAISREIGWRFTNLTVTDTLSGGENLITPPAGFLWADWLEFAGADGPLPVDIVSWREFTRITRLVDNPVEPMVARHEGTKIKVSPTPPDDQVYTLLYQAAITPLDDTTASNWLLENGADALLWGSCMECMDFRDQPQRVARFESKFLRAMVSLKKMEWRARTSGGNLRATSDYLRSPGPSRQGRV
jgi:hypothetical protein